jgi:hypothetical protein
MWWNCGWRWDNKAIPIYLVIQLVLVFPIGITINISHLAEISVAYI